MQFGSVAIVGRSNVGKSTFLNAALREDLAIVSPTPQTTRDSLLGVVTRGEAQIAFLDTPGMHRPRSELGRRMNLSAREASRAADVVVFMTDVDALLRSAPKQRRTSPLAPGDVTIIRELPEGVPTIAIVNKIDRLGNKSLLLPMIDAIRAEREIEAYVPTSVLHDDGVDRALDEIVRLLPERPHGYDPDALTDRPASYFVREYVREQVLATLGREVPHAIAVSVDRFDETAKLSTIHATLHVEKAGQRAIVIGEAGGRIKRIGTEARKRLERLLDTKVYLELFVRVTPRWRNVPRQLAELGYDEDGGSS